MSNLIEISENDIELTIKSFKKIEDFLKYVHSLSSSNLNDLITYLNLNHPNFINTLIINHCDFTLADVKILYQLNYIFLKEYYKDEVFEHILTTIEKTDTKTLKTLLKLVNNLQQFKTLLFFKNISPLQKIENRSLYYYIESLREQAKILSYLYENHLDIYENFEDIVEAKNFLYLIDFYQPEKISAEMFLKILCYADPLREGSDKLVNIIQNILMLHNYFSREICFRLFSLYSCWRKHAHIYKVEFIREYLKKNLNDNIFLEIYQSDSFRRNECYLELCQIYGWENMPADFQEEYLFKYLRKVKNIKDQKIIIMIFNRLFRLKVFAYPHLFEINQYLKNLIIESCMEKGLYEIKEEIDKEEIKNEDLLKIKRINIIFTRQPYQNYTPVMNLEKLIKMELVEKFTNDLRYLIKWYFMTKV